MPKTIAILEANTSGCGKEILESALRKKLKTLFVIADKKRYRSFPLSEYKKRGLKIIQVPTANSQKVIQSLEKEAPLSGIICLNDKCIEVASQVAEHFRLPFLNQKAAFLFRNKEKTSRFCNKIKIPTPKTQKIQTEKQGYTFGKNYGYPFILKPNQGTGSQGVFFINSSSEFKKFWLESKKSRQTFIAQEFKKGPLFSTEFVVHEGHVHFLGITDRTLGPLPYFVELSFTFPINMELKIEKKIKTHLKKIVKALKIETGIFHIEWILTKQGPVLIEVNPRLGGVMVGEMISKAYDQNIFDAIIDMSLSLKFKFRKNPKEVLTSSTLYADRVGILKNIAGIELAKTFPGVESIVSQWKKNQKVSSPKDFQGALLHLISKGKTVALSKSYNHSAMNVLRLDLGNDKSCC